MQGEDATHRPRTHPFYRGWLDDEPRWVRTTMMSMFMVISMLSGLIGGFLISPFLSDDSLNLRHDQATFTPLYESRPLEIAVEEDLDMSLDQWREESDSVLAQIADEFAHGSMPIEVDHGQVRGMPDSIDDFQSLIAQGLMEEKVVPRDTLPARGKAGGWNCSPGIEIRVTDPYAGNPPVNVAAAFTAEHCVDSLSAETPSDGPLVPDVFSLRSSALDTVFQVDTEDPEKGSDVAITTRNSAAGQGHGSLLSENPVVGFAPMIPGMKVCAHGVTSGWRCGVVQGDSRVSPEGVSYQAIGMASQSGDSGGRVVIGDRAVGVVSSFRYLPPDPGSEDRGVRVLNSWAGSVFDAAMVARINGFDIAVLG